MGSSTVPLLFAAFVALPYISSANPSISKRDVVPNLPYDLATTKYCTYWYDNYEGLTCTAVAAAYQVSTANMALWNPSLTATCGNWLDGISYCVEANGAPTSTKSTITSTSSTKSATASSTVQPTWTALGCYLDSSNPPTLSNRTSIVGGDTAMSVAACETACYKSGFLYAGVEAGSQCWCGSFVANELAANSTDCSKSCSGLATQKCGGTGRINVYKGVLPISSTSTSSSVTSKTSSSATKSSSSSVTSKTSSSATATGTLPAATWLPLGCYSDNTTALTLLHRTQVTGGDTKMTVKLCEAACVGGGYAYAGVEAGSQCFCDSAVRTPGAPASDGTVGCNIKCVGNTTETCGGTNRMNVFFKVPN